MVTTSPGDTFATLVGKLLTNQGGTPDSSMLIQNMLGQIVHTQAGPQVANSFDNEFDLWQKILTNQPGPLVAAPNDTVVDLIRKILTNQAGSLTPNNFDTEYDSLQKIVDNQILL